MASRAIQLLAATAMPERCVDALERAGRAEDAWYILARRGHRAWQRDPAHLWTWAFFDESRDKARLALKAGAAEKAWFAARHAGLLLLWKGEPDASPLRHDVDAIAESAERSIPAPRLEELVRELESHAEFYDPGRRADRIAKHAVPPKLGPPDLWERWP